MKKQNIEKESVTVEPVSDSKLHDEIEHHLLCVLDNAKELYKRKPTNPLGSFVCSLELLEMQLLKF